MQIRRFESNNIQDALKQVKAVFGPEAIILSTRKVHKASSRFGWHLRPFVEIMAAVDFPQSSSSGSAEGKTAPSRPLPKEGPPDQREEEKILEKILSTGLCQKFVVGLMDGVQPLREELKGDSLLETYRNLLQWRLMEAVEVIGPHSARPKIWAFVGPTGVGKTTTLAKLAAHFSLKVTHKITLITIDTYRIGAVEQLKTYGRLLRLPVEVATNREELKKIIEDNSHQDLLLIDTIGRSPSQKSQIEELKDFLTVHPRIENHLLLSATTKDQDLDYAVRHFNLLPVKSYLFTKI
ncbi:MAG TPA: AAA family ATPase, partial [Thermodesulfobacteriota bacterium]|nr:AAA family ATPase [Thermodesulfobacteriota bacterium]